MTIIPLQNGCRLVEHMSAILLQDALDKLRVQLAQHEAAVKTLQGAMLAMQSKMEDAHLQMPALKVSAIFDITLSTLAHLLPAAPELDESFS